jgi:hypothetical protein
MKNYIANPQYSDASGDNWKVTSNIDAAQALNDLTKLSVGTVKNGSDYWAAHVEDISRLMSGYTSLTTDVTGNRHSINAATGLMVANEGDPYIYVDDVSGFTTGQIGVVLEGLQPNHPQYSADATSPDCPESAWLTIQSAGLIPAVPGRQTAGSGDFCAYLPASYPSHTVSSILTQQTDIGSLTANAPTPQNVVDKKPSFYISTAGDDQATKYLQSLLPDFVDGIDVVSINKGTKFTTITLAGWSDAFTIGQTVTLSYETTDMGWYAGVITEILTPQLSPITAAYGVGVTTITAPTSGLRAGMQVLATGIPAGSIITEILDGFSFVISQPTTVGSSGSNNLTPQYTSLTTDLTTTTTGSFVFPTSGAVALSYDFTGTFGPTATFTLNVAFSNASGSVFTADSITGLAVGQGITGAGIQAGTTILSWDSPGFGHNITISKPTTADHSGGITATIALNSNQFLAATGIADLAVGQDIDGNGVPLGTQILGVATSPNVVTISTTGSGSITGKSYDSQAFGATLVDEEVRLTHKANTWDCTYFTTPYYTTSSNLNSRKHGRDLYFPITFLNYRSTPAARFQSMSIVSAGPTYTVTVDDVSAITAAQLALSAFPYLTFGNDIWHVTGISAGDNTFTIAGSTTAYTAENLATYLNGDPSDAIYFYDKELVQGSTIDFTSTSNTGAGVVTFTSDMGGPSVYGNHLATSVVGCYDPNPRYIGSTTVGDLEKVNIYRIGTRTGTTLASSIQSKTSTTFTVASSPTTTDGTWGSADQYGNISKTGGWTPLVLIDDDQPIFTLVVGSGENQEMVRVVWSGSRYSSGGGAYPHGPTMDGKTKSPGVWHLAPNQSFQFNHAVGEPVCTPNVVYSTPGLYNHAKDTPVLGAPDGATVYDQTTGITNYEAAAALIGYNPSGTISTTADAYLDMSLPWRPSGDNGSPNISTTLATPAIEGTTTLEISGDEGFPSEYPSVLQPGIPFLAPEFGRVSGEVAAGATQIPFKVSGEMPTIFPFYANIGGEVVLVTGTNVIS